jgi:hypothetical protein
MRGRGRRRSDFVIDAEEAILVSLFFFYRLVFATLSLFFFYRLVFATSRNPWLATDLSFFNLLF